MFTRWLTVFLVAIGLGVAALELAAPPAVESPAPWSAAAGPLFTDAGGPGLPTGGEIDSTEVSALPRFTE
jgi:hypothetical protein